MDQSINLYGELIIAYLSFITPMASFLFSSYEEGIEYVRDQYEIVRNNTQQNLIKQNLKLAKEQKKGKKIDKSLLNDMKQNLKRMIVEEKKSNHKLSLLNPSRQTTYLVTYLASSFILVLIQNIVPPNYIVNIYNISINIPSQLILLTLSVAFFILSNILLWNILQIIGEIRIIINKKNASKHLDEYSAIMDHLQIMSEAPYVKDIYPIISGKIINENGIRINLDKEVKQELQVFSYNKDKKKVAKNVEIGICFPKEFIIEKGAGYTIYNDELDSTSQQIVRFNNATIHTYTKVKEKLLSLTPLEVGSHLLKVFVKAENMEAQYYKVDFYVS